MKNFINYALIIFHISSVTISKYEKAVPVVYADLRYTKEKELFKYFLNLSKNKNVISKTVFIDGNETSMEKCFHLSKTSESDKPLTEIRVHVYDILYFINIVVSCEFSNIVFSIIEILRIVNDILVINENLLQKLIRSQKCQKIVLQPILTSISSMVLTLIGFQKNIIHSVSKNYNTLKI